MIEQPTVNPDLIRYVFGHIWKRGREEINRLGVTVAAATEIALYFSLFGRTRALIVNKTPVFVSGICPDGPELVTWFQATEDFAKHALTITRLMRNELRIETEPVYIYSPCVHPDAARWFGVLGYKQESARTMDSGWPLYRFVRK